jgi:hypothetical protein
LRAACRKLAQPDRPLLSKSLALVLFALAAAAVAGPLATHALRSFDGSSALGLSLLIAPVIALAGLFATPTSEAWAMGLRRGRPRWYDDAAPPYVVVWLMELGWTALMLRLNSAHLSCSLEGKQALALGLLLLGALSLPLYLHFACTRFVTAAARWGFAVAVAAHGLAQIIAIALMWDPDTRPPSIVQTFLMIATGIAILVPAWVGWRQHVVTRAARLCRA